MQNCPPIGVICVPKCPLMFLFRSLLRGVWGARWRCLLWGDCEDQTVFLSSVSRSCRSGGGCGCRGTRFALGRAGSATPVNAAPPKDRSMAVIRLHETQQIIGDLLGAEIRKTQARSVTYQITFDATAS